jgi:signal peptidase II
MRAFIIFFLVALGTFMIDYNIKLLFVEGYYRAGSCIDLSLHYNTGVAFSFFAFLGENLKWIQAFFIVILLYMLLKEKYLLSSPFPVGLLIGGAIGNLYDRFTYTGVVDYIAWHCGFNFAVFNFADVAIDMAVLWLGISYWLEQKRLKV